eukprot:4786485-Prorocentrum_lima.AAC.1
MSNLPWNGDRTLGLQRMWKIRTPTLPRSAVVPVFALLLIVHGANSRGVRKTTRPARTKRMEA